MMPEVATDKEIFDAWLQHRVITTIPPWVITGGTSGLGRAIMEEMSWVRFINLTTDATNETPERDNEMRIVCDIRDRDVLRDIAETMMERQEIISGVINCAGVNHIAHLEMLEEDAWDQIMDTNAKGIYNTSQAFYEVLVESQGTILNIVSNASHTPMTASLAYNASKGAAHIMTLQLARELTRRHGITVFGISPGKMKGTQMSAYIDKQVEKVRGWTAEEALRYQLAGILSGEEIDPRDVAQLIAFLLWNKGRHKHLTGCVIPYGA